MKNFIPAFWSANFPIIVLKGRLTNVSSGIKRFNIHDIMLLILVYLDPFWSHIINYVFFCFFRYTVFRGHYSDLIMKEIIQGQTISTEFVFRHSNWFFCRTYVPLWCLLNLLWKRRCGIINTEIQNDFKGKVEIGYIIHTLCMYSYYVLASLRLNIYQVY